MLKLVQFLVDFVVTIASYYIGDFLTLYKSNIEIKYI